jgi:hypothetical protein
MFFSGAIGTYALGILADYIGLATALQGMVIMLVIGMGATYILPKP